MGSLGCAHQSRGKQVCGVRVCVWPSPLPAPAQENVDAPAERGVPSAHVCLSCFHHKGTKLFACDSLLWHLPSVKLVVCVTVAASFQGKM